MAHRVRVHNWKHGILKFKDIFFNTAEEAFDYASTVECHSAKVLNERGEVVQVIANNTQSLQTYA
jgi:hypothetical protein